MKKSKNGNHKRKSGKLLPVNSDKNVPSKPDKDPGPMKKDPDKNDPTWIREPTKNDPTRIDEPGVERPDPDQPNTEKIIVKDKNGK